jgi:hypothetical protein
LFLIKLLNLASGYRYGNNYKEFKDWIYRNIEDGIITERFYKENDKELENWIVKIVINQEKDYINAIFTNEAMH